MPILVEGDHALGDSAEIATYLEERRPDVPLIPVDPEGRRRVIELQEHFDGRVGPDARQWIYGMLAEHGSTTAPWPAYYRGATRLFVRLTRRLMEGSLRKFYQLTPENTQNAQERLLEHLAALATRLGDRSYLVGDSLTIADISAAALLAPIMAPDGSPWARMELPEAVKEMQRQFRSTPAGAWILERYQHDRWPSSPAT